MALFEQIARQRTDIERIHAYLQSTGIDYSFIGLAPNVSHTNRDIYEQEGAAYYNQTIAPTLPPFLSDRAYQGFQKTQGAFCQFSSHSI